MANNHVLLLGASGVTGVQFVKRVLTLAENKQPFLTLYVRNAARLQEIRSQLADPNRASKIRVVEGSLTDRTALEKALAGSNSAGPKSITFPPVSIVMSMLGAYPTLRALITRSKATPITDSFKSTLIPAMRDAGVKRILALSTPSAFKVQGEAENQPWKWWFSMLFPPLIVPEGHAEMVGIARAVSELDDGWDWTVFRVPYLSNGGDESLQAMAGELGRNGFTTNTTLDRGSLVRWLLQELDEKKWIRGAPALANP